VARGELTEGSDDDWAILVARSFGGDDDGVARAMALAEGQLGGGGREPGSQGVFGVPFEVETLIRHVGLDADTNRNLTRRMLLLLESREVAGRSIGPPGAPSWGAICSSASRATVRRASC
jgi:hypothetical protein